jgi:HK97 gp10 family phage protein
VKEFKDMGQFARHLVMLSAGGFVFSLHEGLKQVGAVIEARAREEIGTYQPAIGPFQAWPELADSTKADRLAKGFTENDPLYRTGDLRDTISHEQHGLEVAIGSDSDLMVYHEFGTSKMPARPVLGTAAFASKDKVMAILGRAAAIGVAGGQVLPSLINVEHITNP